MNKNDFRVVSVAVAVKADDAKDVAQQLNDVSSNFGFLCIGTCVKVPNREEWKDIQDDLSSDLLDAEENQRRDEKHGLYGGKEDVTN